MPSSSAATEACLSAEDLDGLRHGALSLDELRPELENHIRRCDRCRKKLAALTGDGAQPDLLDSPLTPLEQQPTELGGDNSDPSSALPPRAEDRVAKELIRAQAKKALFGVDASARLGRYELGEQLGAGATGVVYRARDTELDRPVALKVLRIQGRSTVRERFIREAKALAKLSHPNVLTVYEVGTAGDELFIAAELVEGQTLTRWLAQRDRSRAEVLDVMSAAGRGLAAAHAAGLVHRDFKPDNVMVGDDERVRVLDFGLARLAGGEPVAAADEQAEQTPTDAVDLTATGSVMGTPNYMSPEQHEGMPVDARSDQYSFCVSLYQALVGERPFEAESLAELAVAKVDGLGERPVGGDVPPWIWQLLRRGLAADPAARFASMEDLLAKLADDPHVRGRRRLRRGAALAVVLLACTVGVIGMVRGTAVRCPERGALAQAWNDDARARLRTGFEASGRPYGTDTHRRVVGLVDAYVAGWEDMHVEACEATRLRGEQSERLMDLRMQCLARRRGELEALLGVLTGGGETVVDRAVPAVLELPPVSICGDVETLQATVPPPEDATLRAQVAELRLELSEAEALRWAGELDRGHDKLEGLLPRVRQTEYSPLIGQALFVAGSLRYDRGKLPDAERALREASRVAAQAKDDALTARSWSKLVGVVRRAGRLKEAKVLAQAAEPMLARASDDGRIAAQHGLVLADLARAQGNAPLAQAHAERALATLEALDGDDSFHIARALVVLSVCHAVQSRYPDARRHGERALAITERVLGRQHPRVGVILNNLGIVAKNQGDYPAAERFLARSLDNQRAALGEHHADVARPAENLGNLYDELGKYALGREQLNRALTIKRKTLGAEHVQVGWTLANLAILELHAGEAEESLRIHREAVALIEAAAGKDHGQLSIVLISAAWALHDLGRCDEALNLADRAQQICKSSLRADHPWMGQALTVAGACHLKKGDANGALRALDRAHEIVQKERPGVLARTRFELARALEASGSDGQRAKRLAEQAVEGYDASSPRYAAERADVKAWLERR